MTDGTLEAAAQGAPGIIRPAVWLLALLSAVAPSGCDFGATGPVGSLTVRVQTTGAAFDGDGYALEVDGETRLNLPHPKYVATLSSLSSRPSRIELTGVADNCSVDGGPRRTLESAGRRLPELTFSVRCTAPEPLEGVRLLFVRYAEDGTSDLNWLTLDGSDPVPLTSDGRSLNPDIDFNGGILFSRREGAQRTIQHLTQDGSTITPLTSGGADIQPSWAPDGNRFVYVVSRGDTWWGADGILMLGQRDSEAQTVLTSREFTSDTRPRWSPDGTRIAFTRWSFGDGIEERVYSIEPDGRDLVEVLPSSRSPVWSPTSDRLAVFSQGQLKIVRADGSGVVELSVPLGWGTPSDWSTNGRWILFTVNGADYDDVYILDLSTEQRYRITLDGHSAGAVFATEP